MLTYAVLLTNSRNLSPETAREETGQPERLPIIGESGETMLLVPMSLCVGLVAASLIFERAPEDRDGNAQLLVEALLQLLLQACESQ